MSKISVFLSALLLLLFAPIYFAAYQAQDTRRFNIGSWDKRYLESLESYSPRLEMTGPFRHEDGSVEVIGFNGRLSGRTAIIQLPFHVLRSPLRIWIRCHRFGLGGTVRMVVNDVLIDDFVFAASSYPWAGIRAVIPQTVAERGALDIKLITSGGTPSPSHLRSDLGLGLDWVEVDPMSGGATLLPTAYEWIVSYVFLVLGMISFRLFGFPARVSLVILGTLILTLAAFTALRPVEIPTILSWLWLIFPAGLFLQRSILFAYSRNRRALFPVMAVSVSSLVAFTAGELFLRRYEAWQHERQQLPREKLSLFQPNPEGTGSYRLKPNLDLSTSVAGSDVAIRTNSHGMRSQEVSMEPSVRRRIAFLGDSFTFGSWADSVEKSFVGKFEERLSSDAWEVLNFGVGGYGFADMELILTEKAILFEPRFVVLAMFNGNDFRDTYLGLRKDVLVDGAAVLDEQILREKVPERFVNAAHTMASPSPEAVLKEWLRHLALFRFAAPVLRMENLTVDFAASSRFVAYSFWSQFPYPDVAVRAKDVSLETLSRIDEAARANGARLVVVALPTRDQVYSRRMSGEHYDINLPQAYVRLFARERNIPFLDLLSPLRAHVAETNENLFVRGDTHLNNKGHLLVGQYLADWFDCCVK